MHERLGDNLLAIYTDASSIKKGTGIGIGIVYNRELEGITRAFKFAASIATAGQEI
ncbi:uncharacterized protein M421DRAFT_423578 [Didymella exigua CBS 183.55]|uniref:RNase H type-1 domain-containing protein n=1 Tax=Didymella exigua CBS 183.55 TaxID=1150837 RepID=A0A6A5RF67_9PLEO|nr:uncharacterized protein M421DRAFT_423578 [Didymella exigua CBS 183.55]KAF1925744.1 hypothetical protein M421DRAFT_423578 [Didymella exigua CBS 183.55]